MDLLHVIRHAYRKWSEVEEVWSRSVKSWASEQWNFPGLFAGLSTEGKDTLLTFCSKMTVY